MAKESLQHNVVKNGAAGTTLLHTTLLVDGCCVGVEMVDVLDHSTDPKFRSIMRSISW